MKLLGENPRDWRPAGEGIMESLLIQWWLRNLIHVAVAGNESTRRGAGWTNDECKPKRKRVPQNLHGLKDRIACSKLEQCRRPEGIQRGWQADLEGEVRNNIDWLLGYPSTGKK